MAQFIERSGDMGQGTKLSLCKDNEGDIHVICFTTLAIRILICYSRNITGQTLAKASRGLAWGEECSFAMRSKHDACARNNIFTYDTQHT